MHDDDDDDDDDDDNDDKLDNRIVETVIKYSSTVTAW
jgi:hypothetical protein